MAKTTMTWPVESYPEAGTCKHVELIGTIERSGGDEGDLVLDVGVDGAEILIGDRSDGQVFVLDCIEISALITFLQAAHAATIGK